MTNRRSVIPILAALLVLLAGCGQLSTSSEQDDAFAPTEVATQALSGSIDTVNVTGWIHGPTAMAMAVSMAIDSQDVPHVSYVEPDGALAYATRAGGSWPLLADTVSNYATQVSLALGDSGTAHLAYLDGNGLQYALRTNGVWSASTVLA